MTAGCSSEKKEKAEAKKESGGSTSEAKTSSKPATSGGAVEEVASTGTAALRGKVTFDGDPPPPSDFKAQMEAQTDPAARSHCLKGPTTDPTWTVGPDKGVANVVVWVRAPKGKYFKIPDSEKQRTDVVTMDQPYCAFEPHVFTLYPSYWDSATKKQKKTGQSFKVLNSAPIAHNTDWTPNNTLVNTGGNKILATKTDLPLTFKASKDSAAGGEDLIDFKCDIHKWMKGYARVYDHPFVAVTKPDGTFEIKDVPAGAEVEIVYWHESMSNPNGKTLKKVALKEGDNVEDIKISK
jgi:hypothetical protein